jgi:hypothetical protein
LGKPLFQSGLKERKVLPATTVAYE